MGLQTISLRSGKWLRQVVIQFVSSKEIFYEEIVMIKNVIDLLNKNKKLALSRLKKWTVEEYREDERIRKYEVRKC